ncbi:MAG: hypothetical protein JWL96_727 [Sphingomonas bacterium]|nr:hypothetical protein [Sphingomonas bacterium]
MIASSDAAPPGVGAGGGGTGRGVLTGPAPGAGDGPVAPGRLWSRWIWRMIASSRSRPAGNTGG